MLTPAYIEAAKDDNREPVTLISIEDADSVNIDYSSQSDWENSVTLTDVDTDEQPGSVVNERFNFTLNFLDPPAGEIEIINTPWKFIDGDAISVNTASLVVHPVNDSYLNYINATIGWPAGLGITLKIRALVRDAVEFPTAEYITPEQTITGIIAGVGQSNISLVGAPIVSAASTAYVIVQGWDTGLNKWFNLTQQAIAGVDTTTLDYIKPTSQFITSTMAFDVTPTTSPIISIDDVKEAGAVIAYSVFGGNTDPPTNNLGTVVDGQALTPYKFYRITGDFSTTTGGRVTVRGLNLNEGIFRLYGSHRGLPFDGVQSVLPPKAVDSVSQKIDPKKGVATTGQVSFKLLATAETEDMLATGYLAGKDVRVLSGFKSLSSVDDFRPIMVGTWQDFDIDDKKGIISVKLRDMLKQFQNRQLPEETYNPSTGAKTSVDIVYTNANVVAVIKDIFDRLGIRGRYLHPDYDTLETGALSGSDYNLTRTLSDPRDTDKLLDQLAQTAGLFLVPLGDGRLTPKLQDPSAIPTVTLDVRKYKAGKVEGNQKELLTRFITRYNATVADPSSDADYAAGYLLADNVAEDLYEPEKGLRVWLDQWKVGSVSGANLASPPQALIDWCDRQASWFSEPRFSFPLSGIPPYIDVEAGDVVGITGLRLPIPLAIYDAGTTYSIGNKVIYSGRVYRSKIDSNTGNTPDTSPTKWRDENLTDDGLTDNKPFLVTAFKFDTNDAMVSIELREQAEV